MKAKAIREMLSKVPDDPYGAFAWFASQCASGLYRELTGKGKSDTQARLAIVHCFLDMAAGEACRVARREGREPDHEKWRTVTDDAFARAVKRTVAASAREQPANQ
jgi:hypothetical protein